MGTKTENKTASNSIVSPNISIIGLPVNGNVYPNSSNMGEVGIKVEMAINDFASAPPNAPILKRAYARMKMKDMEMLRSMMKKGSSYTA
jgi:hypothetical protein